MHAQTISDNYPNTISITRVREDIDSLTSLLAKYRQVQVLRGQEVLFNAVRPDTKKERDQKIRAAGAIIDRIRSSSKKTGKNLSDVVIDERDKILAGKDL